MTDSSATGPSDNASAGDQLPAKKKIAPELMVVGIAVVGMVVVAAVMVLSRGGSDNGTGAPSPQAEAAPTTTSGVEPPRSTTVDAPKTTADPTPSTEAQPTTTISTTTTSPASTTIATTTTVPAPTTTIDPETGAVTRLTELIAGDATQMPGLEEQWVPQLSAKTLGTEWQGVVYDYQSILADHEALRQRYGAILVDGATYSFRQNGEPMAGWFMTIVPRGYPNPEGALAWCTAEQIGRDDCFAKLITNRADPGATVVLNDG